MRILIITENRRTTYNHEFYLTKTEGDKVKIIDVISRKVVDEIRPISLSFKGNILEVEGEEV